MTQVETSFYDFLAELYENMVPIHDAITIKAPVQFIEALTGHPNAKTYESDFGRINLEVQETKDGR